MSEIERKSCVAQFYGHLFPCYNLAPPLGGSRKTRLCLSVSTAPRGHQKKKKKKKHAFALLFSPILEVAVWSKPCGRYRGPLPRGKAVQVKACDISAAFALSRRTIRYNIVEKHAVFGPKMVADDIVPRSLALREAGLKRRAGLACPWGRLRPSSCNGDFQSRRGKVSSTTTPESFGHRL